MNNLPEYLPWVAAVAGGWAVLNGVLHDIFVLASGHAKHYDRNLLRLLMDGHILLTCGAVLLFCFPGLHAGQNTAYYLAIVASTSLIVYCMMIWPFLKSMGTIMISTAALLLFIAGLVSKA